MTAKNIVRSLGLASAAAALLLGAVPVAAEDQGFSLQLDPLVFGILETDVDTDSAKFSEYRDTSQGFIVPKLHLSGEGSDGNRTLDFTATNIRRDDGRYTLEYGVAGRYQFAIDYNKIPHRFGNNARTIYTETSTGVWEIADPVQSALQTAIATQWAISKPSVNFAFLDGLLAPYLASADTIQLGLQRDRTAARLGFGKMGGFTWGLDYTHENRTGNRPLGTGFGFSNVTELPEPIDYDTTGATLSGEWNGKRGGMKVGYTYSKFENQNNVMIWDNPFRAIDSTGGSAYAAPGSGSIDGPSRGLFDLAPENEAGSLFWTGRYKLGQRGWANGSLNWTTLSQDDPLQAYTLNTAIVGEDLSTGATFDPTDRANLPTQNADNEVEILNLTAGAGTRFGENFTLAFRYRYYDYDNQSKRIEFPGYVRYHAVWEEVPRISVPYAYTRDALGFDLGWDLAKNSSLTLSYTLEGWDRTFREVESSDEDIVKLAFDTRPNSKLGLRASYEMGDRSIDGYETEAMEATFVEPEGPNNQPGLRKYDQAARQYDAFALQAQFYPTEAWNFVLGLTSRKDDYDESEIGLLSDELMSYYFEMGYTPGEKVNFYLFGQISDREVFQRDRASGATVSTNPLDDWTATFDEVNDTWGMGFRAKPNRWTLDVNARWSKADGDIDFAAPPGGTTGIYDGAVDIANYEDIELFAVGAKLAYAITDNVSAGAAYRWEDYTIDSFILQGLTNYLPGTMLLNGSNGDYTGSFASVYLKMKL